MLTIITNQSFVVLHEKLTKLSFEKKFRLLIAYSGGLDSHVLLKICSDIKENQPKIRLMAIHIDHSISSNSQKWANHCVNICRKLKVKLIKKKIDAKIETKNGKSQEAIARYMRYQAMEKLVKKNDCLLTAHHADDQAETLLLQLFRGAGPKGLSAMPEIVKFGKGFLYRPLLSFPRKELQAFAHKNSLDWIEDESNSDLNIDRNYIRHSVMPIIKNRWQGILKTLNRTAKHCAEASELLFELAAMDYKSLMGSHPNTLSRRKLLKLSLTRQSNVLRYWLHLLKLSTPSNIKLQQVQKNVLASRHVSCPLVAWDGTEVRRYADDVYAFVPLQKLKPNFKLKWVNLDQPLLLPANLGFLRCKTKLNKRMILAFKNKITVRFRIGGERCQLPNRVGRHELKKLFQEWRIPPWLRDRTPLVYYQDEIIAIVGYASCVNTNRFANLLIFELFI